MVVFLAANSLGPVETVNTFNIAFVSLPGILRHALTPAVFGLLKQIIKCLRALYEEMKR
jgi:hypothetical protein